MDSTGCSPSFDQISHDNDSSTTSWKHFVLDQINVIDESHFLELPGQPVNRLNLGFHSWMWKGLSFLLPFLYGAYAFQFYNGLTLYKLSLRPECEEWQVIVLSGIFLLLSAGNTFTTTLVVVQKLRGKLSANIRKHLRRIQNHHHSQEEVSQKKTH